MRRLTTFCLLGLTLIGAAACDNSPKAPDEVGVCYEAVLLPANKIRYNVVAKNQPNLENCAARLENMRLKFLALGGNRSEIMGAYQGQFIFVQLTGIFVGQTLTSIRYPALVRTGDGRLAIPGAMPQAPAAAQPAPQTPPAK